MVLSIIQAVIGFSLLVFVHELGHFLAAKWIGVKVEVFSLGFGPCLKKAWGGTEYRLSLIPLGGYVKMAGEEPKPGKEPAPGDFFSKSVGQRAIVFAAGAAMNLVFGFVVFVVAYRLGVPVLPAVVGTVIPEAPAWRAGLERGDRIVGIDDISPPLDFEDLKTSVILAGTGKGLRLVVERKGETFEQVVRPEYDEAMGFPSIGIVPESGTLVGEPAKGGGAGADRDAILRAGMKKGDVITDVWVRTPVRRTGEGVQTETGARGPERRIKVKTHEDFAGAIAQSGGLPVRIGYLRNGMAQEPVTVTPQTLGEPRWLGVRWGSNRVQAVREGGWAARAGFRVGDVVRAVGGRAMRSTTDVMEALAARPGQTVQVTVERSEYAEGGRTAGRSVQLTVPRRQGDKPASGELSFALDFVVDRCFPGFPSERAGLQPGDWIVSANGKSLERPGDLGQLLAAAEGGDVELAWRRGEEEIRATIRPVKGWQVPVTWEIPRKTVKAGFLGAFRLGGRKAWQWILRVPATIRSLLRGSVSSRNLNGPLMIAVATYGAAQVGMGYLLYILGVFSVNLGILNLLPVPVLDGGHLLFALFEKVRGKPLNERIRAAATYAGLALILALVAVAFRNDIRVLFFG